MEYSLEDKGLIIKLVMHKEYTVNKDEGIADKIKNWFVLYLQKEKRKNKALFSLVQYSYYPHFEFELMGEKPEN